MFKNQIIENSILNKIKITSSYQKILNFIQSETEDFLKQNSVSLSSKIKVSQSTISRFALKLGFESFNDLQIYISQRYQFLKLYDLDVKEKGNLSLKEVVQNIRSHYFYAIEKTFENVENQKSITNYIDTIIKYHKLNIFFAKGESALVAKYLATNLRKIGFNAIFIDDIHEFYSFTNIIKDKMHITIISRSLKTLEVKNILNFLNENKVIYSVWTKSKMLIDNYQPKNVLFLDSINQNYRIGAIGSKISAFALSDVIFSYLSNKIDRKRILFKEINKSIENWNSLIDTEEINK
ncbi:MurR/RpiR family transcriptional regulator [Mesomycoplasma lagogenitalium]|uniref:MurR/RpiR family transcriptional regulator n=1 Tax=Mesomycoplasma lagogenitalium TaxID=171286 RepID=A0ABY8LTZ2_9BACT|nr:MurR/RpiR family transcriptional regulator [Mesomycoplasma lagogenitalium]WGI36713.1 MurR/RpiR family transcriptional regulator [Mesomycoplasma lagogenitalium]